MIGLFDAGLRAEGLWHETLLPEGWMGEGFILTGGEEEPQPPSGHPGMLAISPVGPGYVRIRRRFFWRAA